MSSPRRESSRSRLSPSLSREFPRNERRTHSGVSRRNSQADPEVPPNGHQHPGTPRTQAPHSGAPTYGSYFYQASPRLSQAFRSRSQPRPRSSAPPYEEVWTCRAPRWRSEIMVIDRTRGVFGGVSERVQFPISISRGACVQEIVRFLTEGRRGVRVMVVWRDGAKEPLDSRIHSTETLAASAERLELKFEQRVHW